MGRIAKRIQRFQDQHFTSLDHPEIPSDNNFAERQIRPAVILRKNSHGNRSDQGAATQAVMMTIFRTLHLRNLNPVDTIAGAIETYLETGKLPPMLRGTAQKAE